MTISSWLSILQPRLQTPQPELQSQESDEDLEPELRRSLTFPLQSPWPVYYDDKPPMRRRLQRTYKQDGSLFFRLPLELRLTIYEYVFGGWTLHVARHTASKQNFGRLYLKTAHLPGVVCDLSASRKCSCTWNTRVQDFKCTGELSAAEHFRCQHGALVSKCQNFSVDLLFTCRKMYSEAIKTLYAQSIFTVKDVAVLLEMQKVVPPHRLQKIRQLSLEWEDRSPRPGFMVPEGLESTLPPRILNPNWVQACAVLASMTDLRRLVIAIKMTHYSQTTVKIGGEKNLAPLLEVTASELFEVIVPWFESPQERALLKRGARFKLVRDTPQEEVEED